MGPESSSRTFLASLYRPRRILTLALILVLAKCAYGYIPWPSEREVKRFALEKMQSTLQSLPQPPDVTAAKFPGTDDDDVHYRGNYRGQDAFFEGHYFTRLSPEETCRTYLRFFESRPQLKLGNEPCTPRAGNLFIGISAAEEFPGRSREVFTLRISFRPALQPPAERANPKTEINIHMHYAKDMHAAVSCLPSEGRPTEPGPCADAKWRERPSRSNRQ